MKQRTREQVETAKLRAERFLRDVIEDDDRADEVADESVEDYAERKHIEISNPSRRNTMPSKRELEEENDELRAENERLQDRLDQIVNVAAPDDDEDEDDESDEDEDEADDATGDAEGEEADDDELAAAGVPARENGRLGRFVSRKRAERQYERAVAEKAVADTRLERARARLGK